MTSFHRRKDEGFKGTFHQFLREMGAAEPSKSDDVPATRAGKLDGDADDSDDPGSTLPDHYRLIRPLGAGGMGQVWQAAQLSTGQAVAVKFLKPALATSPHLRVAFEHEVRLAASLNHPSIARVYDSGLHLGTLYYIMECIEGMRIDRFCESASLGARGIVELLVKVCDAVHFAHSRGVIHLDLKPANILVENESGLPKVLDFGLARTVTDTSVSTESGHPYGTLGYMPPEQARGEAADARSDVYALGACLLRLLTGRHPYDTSTGQDPLGGQDSHAGLDAAFARVAAGPEPAIGPITATHEEDLRSILLKATRPLIEARYASVSEMAADLRNWLSGDPVSSRPQTLVYLARRKINKHRVIAAVVSLATLGLLGSLGTLVVLAARNQVTEEMRVDADRKCENAIRGAMRVLQYNLPEPLDNRMYAVVTEPLERQRLIASADELETLARQATASSNPALRELAARIRMAQADTALMLGEVAIATGRLEAALGMVVPKDVHDPRERMARAMMITRLAQIEIAVGLPDGAEGVARRLREARDLTRDLVTLTDNSMTATGDGAKDNAADKPVANVPEKVDAVRTRGWALITSAALEQTHGEPERNKDWTAWAREGTKVLLKINTYEATQGERYLLQVLSHPKK